MIKDKDSFNLLDMTFSTDGLANGGRVVQHPTQKSIHHFSSDQLHNLSDIVSGSTQGPEANADKVKMRSQNGLSEKVWNANCIDGPEDDYEDNQTAHDYPETALALDMTEIGETGVWKTSKTSKIMSYSENKYPVDGFCVKCNNYSKVSHLLNIIFLNFGSMVVIKVLYG